jgi:hypothetical protein
VDLNLTPFSHIMGSKAVPLPPSDGRLSCAIEIATQYALHRRYVRVAEFTENYFGVTGMDRAEHYFPSPHQNELFDDAPKHPYLPQKVGIDGAVCDAKGHAKVSMTVEAVNDLSFVGHFTIVLYIIHRGPGSVETIEAPHDSFFTAEIVTNELPRSSAAG